MNAKSVICRGCNLLGISNFLQKTNKTPRVIFYHGVSSALPISVAPENIHLEEFEYQLKYLSRNYNVIGIEEFEDRFKAHSFVGDEILITFDDGYANNLYEAVPLLHKYEIPATMFVSTEHSETGSFYPTSVSRILINEYVSIAPLRLESIGRTFRLFTQKDRNDAIQDINSFIKTSSLDKTRQIVEDLKTHFSEKELIRLREKYKSLRPLRLSELKSLSQAKGITIGSHCDYHICCHEGQDVHVIKQQLTQSKIKLEELIGKSCKYLAYPNGDFVSAMLKCVELNYNLAFTTKAKERITKETSPILIPRLGVPTQKDKFKLYLGLYPQRTKL